MPTLVLGSCALALFVAGACASEVEPPQGKARRVILITCDTLRADHLGACGYALSTSLHLDQSATDTPKPFDERLDPAELHDIAAQHAADVQRLGEGARKFLESRTNTALRLRALPSDEATERGLRRLGYAGSDDPKDH